MKAVRERAFVERLEKKLKKLLKKYLTKAKRCDIIIGSPKRGVPRGGNRSLKIEQQEISTKQEKSAMKNLDQF